MITIHNLCIDVGVSEDDVDGWDQKGRNWNSRGVDQMTVYLKTSSIKLLIKHTHSYTGWGSNKSKRNIVDLPPGCQVLWWPLSCQAASTSRERRHCSCRTPRQNLRTQPCARNGKKVSILQTLLLMYTLNFGRCLLLCRYQDAKLTMHKIHLQWEQLCNANPFYFFCPCISLIPFTVKTILLFLLFLFAWFYTNCGRQRSLRVL